MEDIYILSDMNICRKIGEKIKRTRLKQNVTQESLAEAADISVSAVKRIESGGIKSFDSFQRVLRVLGLLDVMIPLVKEDEMSPNEYYEFVKFHKRRQRKRAAGKIIPQPKIESEW